MTDSRPPFTAPTGDDLIAYEGAIQRLMTRRPQFDERDPLPAREWREASSTWHREEAKRLTAEAVRKAKEKGGRK